MNVRIGDRGIEPAFLSRGVCWRVIVLSDEFDEICPEFLEFAEENYIVL